MSRSDRADGVRPQGASPTRRRGRGGTLSVNWDGAIAYVTYTLFPGYSLEEVHVYAGDGSPTTIAPGQYGYLHEFDPNATTYTFTVPLEDTNGTGGVWLVAHAVVCK